MHQNSTGRLPGNHRTITVLLKSSLKSVLSNCVIIDGVMTQVYISMNVYVLTEPWWVEYHMS